MNKLPLVPALAVGAMLAGVPVAVAATTVTVGDNYFAKPSGVPSVSVKKGATVKWVWRGKSLHNVSVTKGPAKFKSSAMTKGSFSRKLTKKGSYAIVCTIHGASDQSMKLIVR